MSSLFLSYRRSDCPDTVKLLHERLKARLPRWEIFYDHQSIQPGEAFPDRLRTAVTTAKVVFVIIGPQWLRLLKERGALPVDHVHEEIKLALLANRLVIPVLVQNASMPCDADLADFPALVALPSLNAKLPLRPEPDFDSDLDKLVAFLEPLGPSIDVGTVLSGNYRLVSLIGEGGMGIVYKAHQLQPKRDVAVKLIKPGMDSKEVLARFGAERQALAVMNHPNIAKVLEAGTTAAGRPFFVMEYVKGVPITQYCDEKKLTPNDRLKLYRQVCEAVQHAHQKGIIHRDIKPTNVLVETVDGQPVPKVIDFGLAKALNYKLTDASGLMTQSNAVVGTLLYSSPEQAAGKTNDIDTRTDIYSLGALLYELLVGEPPFTEAELNDVGNLAMTQRIIDNEPSTPSAKLSSSHSLPSIAANRQLDPAKLTRQVRGELDWIVMKALEKEPNRRYETSGQLSDDIERYLNHEPVKAGKPSTVYQLKKFVRRNRGPVLASCLILASIVGGLILVSVEQNKTAIALTQRQTALTEAETEKNKAIENATLAAKRLEERRTSLDEMLSTFSDDKLRSQPGSQPIRKLFLERGLAQYQSLLADQKEVLEVSLRMGDTLRELSQVKQELGYSEASLTDLQKAIGICREALQCDPTNTRLRIVLGNVLYDYGQALISLGRTDELVPVADEECRIFELILVENPDGAECNAGMAKGLIHVGVRRPIKDGVHPDDTEAVSLLRKAVAADPNNADYISELGRAINNRVVNKGGDSSSLEYLEAIRLQDRAIEIRPTLSVAHNRKSRNVRNLTYELRKQEKFDDALKLIEDTVAASRQFVASNPAVLDGVIVLSDLLWERALVFGILKRYDEAVSVYQEVAQINDSLAQREPSKHKYPLKSLESVASIARLYRQQGRKSETIQILDSQAGRADEIMRLHPGSNELLAELMRSDLTRGDMLVDAERYEPAREAYERAIALHDRFRSGLKGGDGETTQLYLTGVNALVDIAVNMKNTSLAIEILEARVRGIDPHSLADSDMQPTLLTSLGTLADLYAKSGQNAKALALRREQVADARKLLKGDSSANWYLYQSVFNSHKKLAEIYRAMEDQRGAFASLRDYLSETEPYVYERDHSKLLAEAREFSPENLAKLWTVCEGLFERGGIKRFTVPIAFDGGPSPVHIYVADSWRYLEDQFGFWEKVRGGKVPVEIRDSFSRLYKIARENKLTHQEVCVYSLGTVTNDRAVNALFEKVARQKEAVSAHPGDNAYLFQLAEDLLNLAAAIVKGNDPLRADLYLDDLARELEKCRAAGVENEGRLARLQVRMAIVKGQFLFRQERIEAASREFLDALRSTEKADALPAEEAWEIRVGLGKVSEAQKHLFEAAAWYVKAAEAGSPEGLNFLMSLAVQEPGIIDVLPRPLQQIIADQKLASENLRNSIERLWPKYSDAVEKTVRKEQASRAQATEVQATEAPATTKLQADLDALFKDQFAILLLRGKNVYGDIIYCYLKSSIRQLKSLDAVLKANNEFVITDYGIVIAAGKGKPSRSIKREIAAAFPGAVTKEGSIHDGQQALVTGPWLKLLETKAGDLPYLLLKRSIEFSKSANLDEVVRSAAKLREIGRDNSGTLYNAACAYAIAARTVTQSKAELQPAQADRRQKYLELAMECITESVAAGFSDFDSMLEDDDLTPLRALPSFIALLRQRSLTLGPWDAVLKVDAKALPEILKDRVSEFMELGDAEEVMRCADKFRELGSGNSDNLYDAACLYSRTAGLLSKNGAPVSQDERKKLERCEKLAIDCLKEAISAGFTDYDHMIKDADLSPLRDLPEFKALLLKE